MIDVVRTICILFQFNLTLSVKPFGGTMGFAWSFCKYMYIYVNAMRIILKRKKEGKLNTNFEDEHVIVNICLRFFNKY